MAISERTIRAMREMALEARAKAYAPYSGYKVGTCLLAKGGSFYKGANVENAIYRGTHAEKLALDIAVMKGEREFLGLVVMTDDPKRPYPCGQCLQDLTEFDVEQTGALEIMTVNPTTGEIRKSTLAQLLPERFGPANLGIDVRRY